MFLNVLRTAFLAVAVAFSCFGFAQIDETLLKAAEARKPTFVADLEKLVNIDSGTGNAEGLSRIEGALVARLTALGADVQRIPSEQQVAGNIVIGRMKGKGAKKALLMIHYDTVFGPGEAEKRPFRMVGNKATGPGVADAKAGLLLILNAVEMLKERGFDDYKTITVCFNADEEKGSRGSRGMIRKLAADQDVVLSFEPPEKDQVIVATNGIALVHLDVKGVASHAGSAPEKGRNAAIELANQLLQLNNLGDPSKGTSVNWTVVQSGERRNIIPDKATATADLRLSVMSELERVQNHASQIIQKKMIPDTEVTVRVAAGRPPFPRNANTDMLARTAVSIYRDLGKSLEPVSMGYGTDAGYAFNSSNSEQAVLEGMGIVGDKLHSPDEWADMESVAPRLYLTVKLLEKQLSGKK